MIFYRNSRVILGFVAIISCLILSVNVSYAQTGSYYYEYDKAGNRVTRTYTAPTQKRAVADSKNTFVDRIYPNPANDFVNVEIVGVKHFKKVSIEIINPAGKKIISQKNINKINTRIDFPKTMPNGVYTLRIKLDNKTKIHKLIKMK